MEKEIWKDIEEFEGYQVSNHGRVRSLERIVTDISRSKLGRKIIRNRHMKGNIIKPCLCWGYHKVVMHYKNRFVHRLVAKAFIPNPNNFPFVNHKDENPLNNHVSNLEWCTNKYNLAYGTTKTREIQTKIQRGLLRQVVQCDIAGNEIQTFASCYDAARQLGIPVTSIRETCHGRRKAARGFIFKFS